MTFPQHETLQGDRAKLKIEDDAFGLDTITASITSTLLSRISADGYAIGIEGRWGEGKSSLINFISSALSEHPQIHRVIRFEPWLVGTKGALLNSLFGLLVNAIREFGNDPLVKDRLKTNPQIVEKTLAHIASYMAVLERGGPLLDAAIVLDPTGYSKIGRLALRLFSFIVSWFGPKARSLEELKEDVRGDLQTLSSLVQGLRFTVVIDDLDRLEPAESVEILRLVKAVADFPLITYLVCFDRQILCGHVQRVLKVEDGEAYLEKIFQAFLPLPPQEPFALRRFTRMLLAKAFPEEMARGSVRDREQSDRQQVLFDNWFEKFIETPRDAVRLCEAVKFGWPYMSGQADFLDYVWLQLVKLKCRPLYGWIREYVVNLGAYRDGGRPSDKEPTSQAHKLRHILEAISWDYEYDKIGLGMFLPGTKAYANAAVPNVFKFENKDLDRFENGRRLGSPSHWRIYFSFDKPSYALDDDLLATFLRDAVSDTGAATRILQNLIHRPHDHVGYYFRVFLERLYDRRETLTDEQHIGVARTLAEIMDLVVEPDAVGFGLEGPWRRAVRLMGKPIAPYFNEIVRDAFSINWLADVIRDQSFALGVSDADGARVDRQWLTREQFDTVITTAIERFRALGVQGILKKPQPLEILFCWRQLGLEDELRDAIDRAVQDNTTFLDFLDACRTFVNSSSRGLYRPIRSEILTYFLDPDSAKTRLELLAADGSDEPVSKRARVLLADWEDDRR